jgi:hypothetical protein
LHSKKNTQRNLLAFSLLKRHIASPTSVEVAWSFIKTVFPSSTGSLVNDGKLLVLLQKAVLHSFNMIAKRDLRAFQKNARDYREKYSLAILKIAPGLRKNPGLVSVLPGIRSAFDLIRKSSMKILDNDLGFSAITIPAGAFVPSSDITRLIVESFVMRETIRVMK